MSSWKVGDKAIIDYPLTPVHGQHVTIVSIGEAGRDHDGSAYLGAGVDIPWREWPSGHCVFRYSQLIPIPDDKHNFERFHSNLKPCDADYEWNPNEVVRV